MACTPVNKPTKTGLVGQPSESAAQRRRAYSVQRTGDQLVDRNLDLIQQALREENRGLVDIENVMPALLEAAGIVGTGTGVDDSTDLGTTPITDLTEGTIRFVGTFRSFFRLDKTNSDGHVADGISYISALGGIGMWIRLPIADPYWATQTAWYIDPAQTNAQPGDDENSGLLTTAPLKSMAEFRRRMRGAICSSNIVMTALSSSTVADDGVFTGWTMTGTTTFFLIGSETVVFSGSITSPPVPYLGNVRGTVTDSGLASSWTASGGISTPTVSKYIRKTGTDLHASLLVDMGSKTVQIGLPTTFSMTSTGTPSGTITDFSNGDAYQVVTRFQWPCTKLDLQLRVRYQCLDVTGTTVLGYNITTFAYCGMAGSLGQIAHGPGNFYGCVFLNQGGYLLRNYVFRTCSFLNITAPVQMDGASPNWNAEDNVFVNTTLRVWHGGALASSGNLRFFDNVGIDCLSVRHNSKVNLNGLVGSGNTGKLIIVEEFGVVHGGANAAAVTSDPLPFKVAGTSYATPVVSAGSGDGIYS